MKLHFDLNQEMLKKRLFTRFLNSTLNPQPKQG